MSFFRKAFQKISHSDTNNDDAIKATTALPALSFQHDFGVAVWNGTSPRETTIVPITISHSDSSRSPSSKISLADSGFRSDDTGPLPPPKFPLTSRSQTSLTTARTDESMRHSSPKKSSVSSFRPFLTNLAGLKISSSDAQVHDESDLSFPLPTPEPLSSNASTPNSILPPPISKGRRRRRPQNIETVVHSFLPASFGAFGSSAVVDPDMAKRLEEAAKARRSAATASESSVSVDVLPEKPAVSWPGVDEGPLNHVEADRFVIDNEPLPTFPSLPINSDYLSPFPVINGPFSSNGLPVALPTQEQLDSKYSAIFDEDVSLFLREQNSKEENTHTQALQNEPGPTFPVPEVPDTTDSHDYSYNLIDDYVTPFTIPPPIPSFPVPQYVPATQPLEEELDLLRSRLAESKARIDSLVEEKLQMLQRHHQAASIIAENVKKLEQKESSHCAKIAELVAENERLKADRDDVVQQLKSQIEENENMEKQNKELQKESLAFREFKTKMRDDEIEYERLFKEKDSWQGQIDSMHQRLSDAERRVRCLDIITRQKYEARQDRAYGSGSTVGRSTKLHFSPHVKGPSMDVVMSVTIFNEEVLQTASYIVEHLEELEPDSPLVNPHEVARAKEIWGLKVVTMLQQQAQNVSRVNDLLLKNCLEVFMIHWCVDIAEGWYPKQPSFSDILVELSAQTGGIYSSYGKQQICGKQIKVVSTGSAAPNFDSWVKDVVKDLTSILVVGGVRMPVLKTTLLPGKIEPLLKLAYNLRLALAERDICGGLEISAPSPDVPFHPQFMEDAEEFAVQKSRKRKVESPGISWRDGEYIAGTNGIGLKRTLNGQPGVYEMVVKPKVSLIRVLETVF